ALFDNGAMTSAMCTTVFKAVKHRLGGWKPCNRPLWMANGMLMHTVAEWTGMVSIEGVEAQGSFLVFNSRGGWAFLFRKPLLTVLRATHSYHTDQVTIMDGKNT
ncbi:hypothetical protein PISMIDRAFT_72274, partial [Pisolithus microcarpus 441]